MMTRIFCTALLLLGAMSPIAASADSFPSGALGGNIEYSLGYPGDPYHDIAVEGMSWWDNSLSTPGMCLVSLSCGLPVQIVQPVANAATTDFQVTIGTTSTQLIAASTNGRMRVTVVNESMVSGNDVFCRSDGGTAALNTGIDLAPNKGGYEWIYPLVGNSTINCIAVSGAAVVSVEAVQ